LVYQATHQNMCMYYSLLCSDQRHVADRFELGLLRQVEAWACLVHCNGPDKHHQLFWHLLTVNELPTDILPAWSFIDFYNATDGGLVMSLGTGRRHRPHWIKPYIFKSQNDLWNEGAFAYCLLGQWESSWKKRLASNWRRSSLRDLS
jgi:hypothetical protein